MRRNPKERTDALDALIQHAVSTDAEPSSELNAILIASLNALDAEQSLSRPGELRLWQLIVGAAAALVLAVLCGAAVWMLIPMWPLRIAAWMALAAPAGGLMLMLVLMEQRRPTQQFLNLERCDLL